MLAQSMIKDSEGRTSAEKECDQREDHLLAKFLVEEEHAQHNPDWHKA